MKCVAAREGAKAPSIKPMGSYAVGMTATPPRSTLRGQTTKKTPHEGRAKVHHQRNAYFSMTVREEQPSARGRVRFLESCSECSSP